MTLPGRILALVAGFVAMALVVMVVGLTTIADYNRMMADYSRVSANAYMGERLNYLISNAEMESRGLYNAKSRVEARTFAERLNGNLDQIDSVMKHWRQAGTAGKDVNIGLLEAQTRGFIAERRELARVGVEVSPQAAERIGRNARPMRMEFQDEIDRIVARTRVKEIVASREAKRYSHERVTGFFLVTLAWISLTTLLSLWLVSHFITREITRARIAEDSREKLLKELMESNTELERFAYVASHDMQEPVRMVNIYSQMVASDYVDKVDDRGRNYLNIIAASAARMHLMVQDLLRYSRLRSERGEESPIDLEEQLKFVRANLGQRLADTGAIVTGDGLPRVFGNPVQIQRLLENLISNGIKYQLPGQIPEITVTAEDQGARWQINVQDNGIGVEVEFAAQIFEPFRRLYTWDQYQGTGLGLTICRKIVERHGGTIWVESEPGKGARFCFTLAKPPVDAAWLKSPMAA